MRIARSRVVVLTSMAVVCLGSSSPGQAISVPPDSSRWQFLGNAKIIEHLGRRCLSLEDAAATLKDFELTDGVIDVDIAVSGVRGFPGFLFRWQGTGERLDSLRDGETVYLRPHLTGLDDAQQYTPIFNGAAPWQIYNGPGFTRAVDIPRNSWVHVRLAITGAQARLYVGDMREPSLIISDLKSRVRKGKLSISGPACYANIEILQTPEAAWQRQEPATPAGTITRWSLSPMLDAGERDLEQPLSQAAAEGMTWQDVTADPPGFVVINRYRRIREVIAPWFRDFSKRLEPPNGMKLVYARTTIVSDRDQIKKLNVGYSDELSIFLNNAILFRGRSGYRFRDPGFLGVVNPENDAVYLPLKKGRNELVLAVSELMGGWGFICRFDDANGVRLNR